MKKIQIVKVNWLDSRSQSGWQGEDPTWGLAHCETVGFLVDTDRDYVKIAQTTGESVESINAVICIPKKMITKIETLAHSKG